MTNRVSAFGLCAALLAVGAGVTHAQDASQAPALRGSSDAASGPPAERQKRQAELEAIETELRNNAANRTKLDAEIAAIREDRAKLNGDLFATVDRMRGIEQRLSATEQRLAALQVNEQAIRRSLQARSGLIGEVLAALQRMGRKPPPAIFVRPEDILEAVRASIALGGTLPELRAETQALARDLTDMVRLRDAIGLERTRIASEVEGLARERVRLGALVDARQAALRATEKSAGDEAKRAAELARQAGSVRELLQKIESDIRTASRQAEEARRQEEARTRETQGRLAALAMRDPARLSPKVAFAEARGALQMPVEGAVMRGFGAFDETGAPARGQSIESRPGSVVTAPADGWVAFAGPFRSFGRLLIVNAGGGYYIVLAGMERTTVEAGQFVLAGEPVAVMGSGDGAAPASEGRQPVLYIEFRKDGASIDPSPVVGEVRQREGSRIMRKIALLMAGAALGAGVVTLGTQTRLLSGTSAVAASSETYRQLSLFGDVFERIRSDYVEKPDEAKLIEAAINGMLTSLDPHSSFLDTKAHRDMQQSTQGKFGGLGIEVTMEEGLIKVVSPIDDTPAAKAGILANDIISHIDGEQVQGLSLNQAVEKMRGPVDTEVALRILRQGRKDPIEVKLKRATITIQAVRTRIDDDVGVVRVTTFNEQTFDGVRRGIEKILAEVPGDKLKGVVLDMRNNPGGLFDQSVSVSDAFLERGEIVSTRGRNADETQRFNAKAGDLTKGKPLVVLINGGSASASEIVAGALQDHKRATIVGTRSFGKGSVQTIIPIGASGAVRLTTARYYTPSGRSIQAKGIAPDIIIQPDVPDEFKGKDETRGESSLRGHLQNNQGEEKSGSSAYVPPDPTKDKQLIYALDLLRGKVEKPVAPKAEAQKPN